MTGREQTPGVYLPGPPIEHHVGLLQGDSSDDWCAACECGWYEWRLDRAGAKQATEDHLATSDDASTPGAPRA
jgi:hypothetical protein